MHWVRAAPTLTCESRGERGEAASHLAEVLGQGRVHANERGREVLGRLVRRRDGEDDIEAVGQLGDRAAGTVNLGLWQDDALLRFRLG